MCGEAQVNIQPLIAEYTFFLSKDWVCELRVKGGEGLR